MKVNMLTTVILSTVLASACSHQQVDQASRQDTSTQRIELIEQGRYHANIFDQSAAEIVAFDEISKQTFVVNAQSGRVDILSGNDIQHPQLLHSLDVAADISQHLSSQAGSVNSVSASHGLLAVAIEAETKTDSGWIAFYRISDLHFLEAKVVGSLPDMVTFTPDGKQVVAAIEGEPSDKNYALDPEGEVAVFDINWNGKDLDTELTRINFRDFNQGGPRYHQLPKQLIHNGFRATISQDLEPEYIAVSDAGDQAYVALQENNAIAVIDLRSKTIDKIMALGFKDHSQTGNEFDGNNKDKKADIKNEPALGMYQPDSVASININNTNYLLTANEGDDRSDWLSRVSLAECEAAHFYYNLEDKACADDITLKDALDSEVYNPADSNAGLDLSLFNKNGENQDAVKRVKFSHSASLAFGDQDNDGKLDKMLTFGGRSFSIWDIDKGQLVFDSGSDFERITAEKYGRHFNQSNSKLKDEDRSDNKGPEPEAITTAKINGRSYAFIGLERMGGIMVYDISEPSQARFIQYINNRSMTVNPADNIDSDGDGIKEYQLDAGDLGPEGFKFVPAEESPNQQPLLIVGNEVSGTTTFYNIAIHDK